MKAKEIEQVMEMLRDMQTIKMCLKEYSLGLSDSGKMAQETLDAVKPLFEFHDGHGHHGIIKN